MTTPKTKLWDIEPHTKAKHLILEKYLNAWFPILGNTNKRVIYIDGFAGPGIYTNGEPGSPVIALRAALSSLHSANTEIFFIFVEADELRAENLRNVIDEILKKSKPKNFNVKVIHGEFESELSGVLTQFEAENHAPAPTFALLDPFGFSGLPFDAVRKLLQYPRCEVMITFMADAINRFLLRAGQEKNISSFFGSDAVFKLADSPENRNVKLRELYQHNLTQAAKFVRFFEMSDSDHRPIYDLFFATKHPKGYVKMKEAMWKVDNLGGFRFSDATNPLQEVLFQKLEEVDYAKIFELIKSNFSKRKEKVEKLRIFVENETPYLEKHLRASLQYAESQSLITVDETKSDGKKRHGKTFPDDVIVKFRQ
jgi:three-Cys-motif partner protein